MPRALLLAVLAVSAPTTLLAQQRLEFSGSYVANVMLHDNRNMGGLLDIAGSRGFRAGAAVFWTRSISTSVAATFLQPATLFYPSTPSAAPVDLGTLGIKPVMLTARYHINRGSHVSGFAAAGISHVTFGNLDDQFGDAIRANVESTFTPVASAGIRYRWGEGLTFEVSADYLRVETDIRIRENAEPRVALPETLKLDSLLLNFGANWRF